MLDEVRRRADEFDIIHFHLSHFLHFPFFEHMPERTVTTPHGRLDYKRSGRRLRALAALSDDLDLRHRSGGRSLRRTGSAPSITGCRPISTGLLDAGRRRATAISPFSAGCRATSGPTGRSRSPAAPGSSSGSPPRSDEDDRAYFHDTIEPLIDGDRDRIYRRDRRGREGGVSRQRRGAAVSRSIGRSRSGSWSSRRWPAARR